MCGIVAAVAEREVAPILLEGLRRLEYRGYDSAGLLTVDSDGELVRLRSAGKVAALAARLEQEGAPGRIGMAHTRWATHGAPTEANAHPHLSGDEVAVVHNGIIENWDEIRRELTGQGYGMTSDTDSEVIAHLIHRELRAGGELMAAVGRAVARLRGAYAIVVLCRRAPDRLIAVRSGSPLVVGIGIGEHFLASDAAALLPVTQRFIYLEEGDLAEIRRDGLRIFARDGSPVDRPVHASSLVAEAVERGRFRHYMLKEIYEQPRAVTETLEGRLGASRVLPGVFGPQTEPVMAGVQSVHLVACGTSYHAALVARYWIEAMAGLPCTVDIASEYRYRQPVVPAECLFVCLSQSGETADTLAALRLARARRYRASLAVCNVPESSLVREADLAFMTRAGPEIGVASTKAFTTQLVAMMLLALVLAQHRNAAVAPIEEAVAALRRLPAELERVLSLDAAVAELAEDIAGCAHALFLGRGVDYPIALEGALKLKEISYIHAEGYAAGELKHGPLALVDEEMPVVAVAANNALLEKLLSNLREVGSRGGRLVVFTGDDVRLPADQAVRVLPIGTAHGPMAPALHVVPLQLLAYHVAVLKGTDVDQPRNLAKSVTVE